MSAHAQTRVSEHNSSLEFSEHLSSHLSLPMAKLLLVYFALFLTSYGGSYGTKPSTPPTISSSVQDSEGRFKSLLEEYEAGLVELRERVRGREGELIVVSDSALRIGSSSTVSKTTNNGASDGEQLSDSSDAAPFSSENFSYSGPTSGGEGLHESAAGSTSGFEEVSSGENKGSAAGSTSGFEEVSSGENKGSAAGSTSGFEEVSSGENKGSAAGSTSGFEEVSSGENKGSAAGSTSGFEEVSSGENKGSAAGSTSGFEEVSSGENKGSAAGSTSGFEEVSSGENKGSAAGSTSGFEEVSSGENKGSAAGSTSGFEEVSSGENKGSAAGSTSGFEEVSSGENKGSAAGSTSGFEEVSSGENKGSASGSASGLMEESSGRDTSASGESGSGTGSPSKEEVLRQWLSGELVRMMTVVYDCEDGSESVGNWRNEAVGSWLTGRSESHTKDSTSIAASGGGTEEHSLYSTDREKRFIFDEDDRVFASQSESFPQCAIARASTGCTAFYIGPYHALTAAHCVNSFRYGWRGRIRLWRERNCHNVGHQNTCSRVFAVFGHTHLKMFEYDYALVEMNRNGEPSPCWFGIGYVNQWDHPSYRNLEVLGYPYDKRRYTGQPECSYEAMWKASCNVSYSVRQNLIQWCDAVSGNSGSPVYSQTDGDKVVYGLHAQSVGNYVYNANGERELQQWWNQGPIITPLRYHQILRWMERT